MISQGAGVGISRVFAEQAQSPGFSSQCCTKCGASFPNDWEVEAGRPEVQGPWPCMSLSLKLGERIKRGGQRGGKGEGSMEGSRVLPF